MENISLNALKAVNFDFRIVPLAFLSSLGDLMNNMERMHEYDEEINRYLINFRYQISDEFPDAKSLLIVAGRSPAIELLFNYNGKSYPVIIPPTYRILSPDPAEILKTKHVKIQFHRIPLKLAAVCSGLMVYGRNNIAYHEKWGSFARLQAYLTDLTPDAIEWQSPQLAKSCNSCQLCQKNCPTGAIGTDRIGIHQNRCITLHNESIDPIPAWINSTWHHALIGCLKCQIVCPMNRSHLDLIEKGGELSEKDVDSLLKATKIADLSITTKKILEQEYLLEDFALIARNFLNLVENL
jgi:epoxyqueuosine reductase